MLSKKATKIDEIFIIDLTLTTLCKSSVKSFSIYVAFLENMNFNKTFWTHFTSLINFYLNRAGLKL